METKELLEERLSQFKNENLNLDMTRGKPSKEQVSLSDALLTLSPERLVSKDGFDVRNYGGLDGVDEAKELFSALLEVKKNEVLVGGNSSLTLMYQYIDHAYNYGVRGIESAWKNIDEPTFLCPVPGYDRHFSITKHFNIKMINIPLTGNGPDMDLVENLIKNHSNICGMWCVPKYSNPTGEIYSNDTVDRISKLANLSGCKSFRVIWDNAYAVHDLENSIILKNISTVSKQHKTEDSIVQFSSTSKITYSGAGVGFMSSSEENLTHFKKYLSIQTIGPDKLNQMRHVDFFKTVDQIQKHMLLHREILAPKFDLTLKILEEEFKGLDILTWTKPKGGYFVSVNTKPGLANKVVKMCESLGVKFTPAGSTYPYMKDPEDKNIRIAPSMPDLKSIEKAMRVFSAAVKYCSC